MHRTGALLSPLKHTSQLLGHVKNRAQVSRKLWSFSDRFNASKTPESSRHLHHKVMGSRDFLTNQPRRELASLSSTLMPTPFNLEDTDAQISLFVPRSNEMTSAEYREFLDNLPKFPFSKRAELFEEADHRNH